jgi:hypothetical protein
MGLELIMGVSFIITIFLLACDQKSASPTRAGPDYPLIMPAWDFNVPVDVKREYKWDAALLTLRKMHEIGGSFDQQVELPKDLYNTVYSALIHVYNSKLPARDSVVSRCEVHIYCLYEPYILNLDVDTAYQWVKAWREGKSLTGNPAIDRLIQQYGLQLAGYWEFCWGTVSVSLRSTRPLNMSALARIFSTIEGVNEAWHEPYCGGGGDDITARAERDFWEFEYSIGWGDCPSGCGLHHYWSFRVYPNGKVEYEGSYGDPGPYGCGY